LISKELERTQNANRLLITSHKRLHTLRFEDHSNTVIANETS